MAGFKEQLSANGQMELALATQRQAIELAQAGADVPDGPFALAKSHPGAAAMLLTALGYNINPADGEAGIDAALRAYQHRNGLEPVGLLPGNKVDPVSQAALQVDRQEAATAWTPPVMRTGHQNRADNIQLQMLLTDLGHGSLLGTNGPNEDGIDGGYGRSTASAVKAFQKEQGLKETGFVDKDTSKALVKARQDRDFQNKIEEVMATPMEAVPDTPTAAMRQLDQQPAPVGVAPAAPAEAAPALEGVKATFGALGDKAAALRDQGAGLAGQALDGLKEMGEEAGITVDGLKAKAGELGDGLKAKAGELTQQGGKLLRRFTNEP